MVAKLWPLLKRQSLPFQNAYHLPARFGSPGAGLIGNQEGCEKPAHQEISAKGNDCL